ncbi:MAG: indolepyruvate oxidoreductase subunit beta [Desulfobacterales bacterium]|jgi:indolepyruvate ferredoxin oxidoreductase beta subunit|nr:indolepyruvate oxidoreductase subunit beta [Desulfobacterales bacterium]
MKTTRVIIVAVGGQGNLLASRVLGEAALIADVPVRMSEIHGMAQRGGVVESSIVFGDSESTIISDGEADVLVGFEPSETLRAVNKCNSKTIMITNLSPTMPFTVNIGKGVYPNLEVLQKLIRAKVANLIAFNATTLAKEAGNVMAVNMVLLGALIQTKTLPISTDHVKTVIRTRTKKDFVQINVTAFDLGYSAAQAVSKVENA